MSDTITAPGSANFVGGQWTASRGGRTYERHNPWRPSEVLGEFPSSTKEDVDDAVGAAAEAWPSWAALPAVKRGAILTRAAEAIEARDRGHRPGHDPRDGQAPARVAPRGRPRGTDLPLLRRRGMAAGRGDVRAVRDRLHRLHPAPAARCGRADHPVELPRRDPGLEARPRAGLRQRGGDEAGAGLPAHRAPSCPGARGG